MEYEWIDLRLSESDQRFIQDQEYAIKIMYTTFGIPREIPNETRWQKIKRKLKGLFSLLKIEFVMKSFKEKRVIVLKKKIKQLWKVINSESKRYGDRRETSYLYEQASEEVSLLEDKLDEILNQK